MKSKAERDYERNQREWRELYEKYKKLSPWHRFEVRLIMYWFFFKVQIRDFPLNWVKFFMDMDRQIKLHGMPFRVKLQLERWFNYPPHKDEKYFINRGRKIWYHCFVEEDNLEIHLYYKGRYPGTLWFHPEKDGTASIVGIDIREGLRNTGLGTAMLQEAIRQIKDRVVCIKGILEIEYAKNIDASLRWLHRQGFETRQKENGDYEVVLWLK